MAARLGAVLADPSIAKIGHDLKATSVLCARAEFSYRGSRPRHDDRQLSRGCHGLESQPRRAGASTHRLPRHTSGDITGKGIKSVALNAVPAGSLLNFAGERADLPLRMADGLQDLTEASLDAIYRDMERPLIPILADIERAGVRLDLDALARLSQTMQGELDRLSASIFSMAGEEFNINSPKQLERILFERLQLQPSKKTGKTKTTSTAMDVLEELAQTHELPGLVLKWRSVQKLKGTYVDALPLMVNPATGRVRTTFNQAVAATGRLTAAIPICRTFRCEPRRAGKSARPLWRRLACS